MGLLMGIGGIFWLLSVIDKTEGVGHACLKAGMLHLDTAGERVGTIYAQLHGLSYVIRPMCLIRDVWSNKRKYTHCFIRFSCCTFVILTFYIKSSAPTIFYSLAKKEVLEQSEVLAPVTSLFATHWWAMLKTDW
jgi:hypothetical protein